MLLHELLAWLPLWWPCNGLGLARGCLPQRTSTTVLILDMMDLQRGTGLSLCLLIPVCPFLTNKVGLYSEPALTHEL